MEYVFLFIFGLAIGSFLNVLIDRLPMEESIMGRSHCDYCKRKLGPYDLIPVLSFFALGGKCRYCKKKISWIYPLVELITGILFATTWFYIPVQNPLVRIAYLGIVSCLIVIFFTDAKYQIIPDYMQIALFGFSLFAVGEGITPLIFLKRAASSLLVMLPILFLYVMTKGRGMGFGDVKLSFIIGFFLGLRNGFVAMYIAFVSGALFGLMLIVLKRKRLKSKIAFGPFLVLGIILMVFFGSNIMTIINKMYPF